MKRQELIVVFLFLFFITALFFYKTILYGYLPFPGDLLVAEYNPWKTYSYLGYVPGSFPNKAQYFDVLRQLYPWKTFAINLLKHGQITLWNPYNFSGAPLFSNFQSAVFYPLNIIYFLPQIFGWSLLVVIQPFLAAFFTYLYARKINIGKLGASFSATSFAFSSFLTVWLEYNTIGQVILWLPLILLSIEHLLNKKEIKWILIFVFSLTSSLLSGHIQIFTYLLCFIIIYSLFRNKSALLFLVLTILVLGLGAVQLIPGFELISQSARSPHSYDFLVNKILIQPWQLIMFFVPDFFGNPATRNYWLLDTYVGKVTSIGLVAVFFILFGIFSKKDNLKKIFIWTCFTVLLLATNNPLTALFYKINIPLISSSAPTLAVFLFCFGASILAGFGVDAFTKNFGLKKYLSLVLPLVFLFFILNIVVLILIKTNAFNLGVNFKISQHNLFYSDFLVIVSSLLLLIAVFSKKTRFTILILLLILNVFDLWRSFEKFNPFSPKELVFPKAKVLEFLQKNISVNRFWGYGTANIEANFATQYSLYSPDGYDPLYPKRYGEFIQSSQNGKIQTEFTNRTRSDAVIANGFGETDFSQNLYRQKVLNILGVKYVLDRAENGSTQKTFPIDNYKLIFADNGWRVFENKNALPRVFLAGDYKTFNTKEEFEQLFFAKDFNAGKTILLEKIPAGLSPSNLTIQQFNNNSSESVNVLEYKSNKVVIKASAKSNKLLFLSDTYYPGWKAYVDGKKTKIYRADYAFRSVFVPAGEHRVVFVYFPFSFQIGLWLSISSLLFLLFFLLKLRKP